MIYDQLYLGLDTSNYTTSVAIVNENDEILEDVRIPLSVKNGEKGLRQSEALYQHWSNLPSMLEPLLTVYSKKFKAVCVSGKPRPAKDSYMPVFNAGISVAKVIAASLSVEMFLTTHQEGHFRAGIYGNNLKRNQPFIAAHLSGGTLELIHVAKQTYTIIGGTKDISYGQLLDRAGNLLNIPFPSGAFLDQLANSYRFRKETNPLAPIFNENSWLNLSGLETQLKKIVGSYSKEEVAGFLMDRIADSLISIIEEAKNNYKVKQVLVTGGVASSNFLRQTCLNFGYFFAQPSLCSDNAVGVALMKGKPFCL
ncbi:MAG: O-sialoglycoprotein endopeptidase [Clostridia bacterium]|nr:O-sialoglycoprotein endopeptidase [Clostridia bacterium]